MSYRGSNGRPSSAASRTSSGHERRGSFGEREPFLFECKAAYLAIFDDLSTHITSRHDLYKVLQQAGRNPVNRTLNKYWTNRTDQLTFEDFCDICRKEPATSEDELLQAFRKMDVNGDGFITNSELRRILTTRGEKMTKEEVQDLIDEVDENRDGKLNYKEFIRMVMKTQEECKRLAVKNLEKKQSKVGRAQALPRSSKAKQDYDDDDDDDDDEIVIGVSKSSLSSKPFGSKLSSPPTPTPRSIRGSIKDQADDSGSTSSRSRDRHEWSRTGLTSKQLTLQKPRNLKDWRVAKSKGCFFFDDHVNIVGHQYNLKVAQDTKAWITIEPISVKSGDLNSSCEKSGAPMDVMLFMLDSESRLVAITDQRDQKGKSAMICDLEKGIYRLIAFTTGCRFKKRTVLPRHSKDVELLRKKDGKVSFTRDYKNILTDVFDMFDLNGDDLLSREEFSLYNLRTSGQEVADLEWEAVEANIDLKDGQITREGFLHLNQMEAEENQDNVEELWMSLETLGFNRALVLDEASPFSVDVHTEKGNLSLKVAKLDAANKNFLNLLAQKSIEEGESFKVKGARDVFLSAQITDGRVCLVVENKSMAKTSVLVDCKQSVNIISHQKSLSCMVDIPPKSAVVAHHLLPVKDSHAWTVVCQESLK